ncbi:MAG: hypothetical protein JST04_02890 [Bdellovibrionales bacterium]|nr:hypothetical protein [Bdellovibrionales bacterium]
MNTTLDTDKVKKNAEAKTGEFAKNFTHSVKEYSDGAMESISDGYETTLAWVKKNPLQAAAIGAGIGFIIGALVRRMASDKSA